MKIQKFNKISEGSLSSAVILCSHLTPIRELWTKNPQNGNIVERHLWTKKPHTFFYEKFENCLLGISCSVICGQKSTLIFWVYGSHVKYTIKGKINVLSWSYMHFKSREQANSRTFLYYEGVHKIVQKCTWLSLFTWLSMHLTTK